MSLAVKTVVRCSMCNETIHVPETSRGQTIECPACGGYIETSSDASIPPRADEDQYEEESDVSEVGAGVDRRLIVVIFSIVVDVGLIIIAAVLWLSGSRPPDRPKGLRDQQQVADIDSRPQPVTSDSQPEEPFSLEDKLYNQTKIAFMSIRDGNYEIYVMNSDGSEQTRLTNSSGWDGSPSWSPFLVNKTIEKK